MRKACTPLVNCLATLADEDAMLKDALYFRMLTRKWRLSASSDVIGRINHVLTQKIFSSIQRTLSEFPQEWEEREGRRSGEERPHTQNKAN